MVKLNIDKLINETTNDEIKCMLYNINTYKDMNDYTHYANYDENDLKELQKDGSVLDITPGTYNGALDKTDYSELTAANIYSVLLEEVAGYDDKVYPDADDPCKEVSLDKYMKDNYGAAPAKIQYV